MGDDLERIPTSARGAEFLTTFEGLLGWAGPRLINKLRETPGESLWASIGKAEALPRSENWKVDYARSAVRAAMKSWNLLPRQFSISFLTFVVD